MSTLTNVFAVHAEVTGTAYAGATNLGGYQILPGGTAGDIILRDGGAAGVERLRFNIATSPTNALSTLLPGNGIRFTSNIHVTLPTNAKITLFCG
jgi:hypothetical protein